MKPNRPNPVRPLRAVLLGAAALALTGCAGGGWDLRRLGPAPAASPAAPAATSRPEADSRGVIDYPGYQVLVSDGQETVSAAARRLGIDADALAARNGLTPGYRPRPGEVLVLPGDAGAAGVEAISGTALATTGTPAATADAAPGPTPTTHRVTAGETAYSIARSYDVSVKALADWNGLDADYTVREGQTLLIPLAAAPAAAPAGPSTAQIEPEPVAPGAGSPTPVPPSARDPLPTGAAAAGTADATPAPASPDLGQYETGTSAARLAMPVSGDIQRDYDKAAGREGIDIAAAPGSAVRAADDGVVALVSRSVAGDTIVLIRHSGNLNTVYDNVTAVTVEKGDTVGRGQTFAQVAEGDPQALRFGVGIGTESTDPLPYLQ